MTQWSFPPRSFMRTVMSASFPTWPCTWAQKNYHACDGVASRRHLRAPAGGELDAPEAAELEGADAVNVGFDAAVGSANGVPLEGSTEGVGRHVQVLRRGLHGEPATHRLWLGREGHLRHAAPLDFAG